ncbi:MAG: hypothetical protein NTZ48_04320, partial [Candidatus Omnitrophica bacterium]|nr:hypothetical protein [Candidatus Omnitrophota bacterium]
GGSSIIGDHAWSDKVTMLPNGNVGIGTNAPGATLSVGYDWGNFATRGGGVDFGISNNDPILYINDTASSGIHYASIIFGGGGMDKAKIDVGELNVPDSMRFFTGHNMATPHMVIDNDGNVGIGTTNPTTTLDIQGSLGIAQSFYQAAPGNGTWYTLFTDTATTKIYIVTAELGASGLYGLKVSLVSKLETATSATSIGTAGTVYSNITYQWSGNDFQISQNYGSANYLRASYIRLLH